MTNKYANVGDEPDWQRLRRSVADDHGAIDPPEMAWRIGVDRKLEQGAHRTALLEQRQQLTEAKHAEELMGIHERIGGIETQNRSLATKEQIGSLMRLQWWMAGSFLVGLLTVIFYAAVHK